MPSTTASILTDARLRLIIENLPAMVAYYDSQWRIQYLNLAAAQWLRLAREEMIGKHLRELASPAAYEIIEPNFARAYLGERVSYRRPHIKPDGKTEHLEVNVMPDVDDEGHVVGLFTFSVDVTDLISSHDELAHAKERLDHAVRGSNLALWDADTGTGQVFMSGAWAEMLGHSAADAVTTLGALLAIIHPDDNLRALTALKNAFKSPSSNRDGIDVRMMSKNGIWKWLKVRGDASAFAENGRVTRLSGTIADISARKLSEKLLHSKEAQLRLVLDNVPAMIFYANSRRRYLMANKRYADFFGIDADEIVGMHIGDVIGAATYQQFSVYLDAVLEGETVGYQREAVRPDGGIRNLDVALVPHFDAEGEVIGCYSLSRDVTETVQAESRIEHMIHHDALTDMFNRATLESRLRMLASESAHAQHVLLYLNVDLLKVINDSCGQAAGDEALRQIAALVRANAGTNMLARLRSDEFGVLLENTRVDNAQAHAERIRSAVYAARFVWKDRSFSLSVSIGVVPLAGQNTADLLAAGDAACRVAKNKGRNRVSVFRPGDNEIALRRSQIDWRDRVLDALEHHKFNLHRQAIHPLSGSDDGPLHYEVLLRMVDATGGFIAPMAFIPAAEHFGLMPQVDRWVVSNTLAANMATQGNDGGKPYQVAAINLSGQTLGDEFFADFLREQFARFPVNPRSICFEITETAAISNMGHALQLIHEFKRMGCQFSLDDFGSGMSSFGYLRNLPVDYLKIDGSFIRNMHRDAIDYAMVESINHIGHLLGKTTIAEFVENEETMAMLKKIGVDHAQGYYIGRPQPSTHREPNTSTDAASRA